MNALLIIDAQKFFINRFTKGIQKRIADIIGTCKFDFVLFVKFVNSGDSNFVKFLNWQKMFNPPETDIVPELERFVTGSNVFTKPTFSAFKSEALLSFIKKNKIKKIYLCGFDTDGCILSTALDAFDSGLDVRVLQDLCASHLGTACHNEAIRLLKRNAGILLADSAELFRRA